MTFTTIFTRKTLLTAASILALGAVAAPVQAQEFTPEQKTMIEQMIKDHILNNGDQIMQGVENYQKKQREEAEEKAKAALEGSGDFIADLGVPTIGPDDASVTVVEFFDYNCGYCKKAFEDVNAVIESDKDVRIAFVEMPILGPSSGDIARWSLASDKQGKYFDYHAALMSHKGSKNEATLKKIAKEVGLDVEQLEKDANSDEIKQAIVKKTEFARGLGVSGTPAFVINKELVRGYVGLEGLKAKIQSKR